MKRMLSGFVMVAIWPALISATPPQKSSEQIGQIQSELERLKEENARTRARMEELERQLDAVRKESAAKSAELEQKVETARPTTSSLNDALTGYWGEHRFVITGSGNARYRWAGRGEANSFSAAVDPIFLYRLSDRAFFKGEVEFELLENGETEAKLEYAQFNYLLNDYTTLVAGKYLLPCFVSAARGAAFETNNFDTNKNKAFGARVGLRPLPFSWDSGRWKIGASTYNGTWDAKDNRWVYAWGLDTAYQYGPWELRGEYLNLLRELPGAIGHEHREGWYVQGAYKLLRFATVPILNRSELIFRYGRQSQPQNLEEEELFLRGSQYSIGYDYWLSPTMV